MTQEPSEIYVKSLVGRVLEAEGYRDLSTEDQSEMRVKLSEHFQSLIVETAVNRMTDEQVADLQEVLDKKPEQVDEKLMQLSATVPGLAVELEERLNREVDHLTKLGQNQK